MSVATALEQAIEAYAPVIELPTPDVLIQARQNLELQTALLREFGAVTAAELAQMNGTTGPALADNWRRRGKTIRVTYRSRSLYPAFQFAPDGRPYPVIAAVSAILRAAAASEWEQAIWWTIPNGLLDGLRPVDVLRAGGDAPDVSTRLTAAASDLVAD